MNSLSDFVLIDIGIFVTVGRSGGVPSRASHHIVWLSTRNILVRAGRLYNMMALTQYPSIQIHCI